MASPPMRLDVAFVEGYVPLLDLLILWTYPMILVLLAVFFAIVLSGPDGKEYARKRKLLKERPLAKVLPFPYDKDHPRKL